jgi:cytoskeletal protein RodZ
MAMQVERYVALGMPGILWQQATMSQAEFCTQSSPTKAASSEHSLSKKACEQPMMPTQHPAKTWAAVTKKMPTTKTASKTLFLSINPPLYEARRTAPNSVLGYPRHDCS